jgi:exocyst complex protein 7
LSKYISNLFAPNNSNPKTRSVLDRQHEQAMSEFSHQRGEWIRKSISSLASKVEEADEGGIWEGSSGGKVKLLMAMWEALTVAMEVIYLLFDAVKMLTSARQRLYF